MMMLSIKATEEGREKDGGGMKGGRGKGGRVEGGREVKLSLI